MTALALGCVLFAPPPADNPTGLLRTFGRQRICDRGVMPLSPDGTRLGWTGAGQALVFDMAGGPPRE